MDKRAEMRRPRQHGRRGDETKGNQRQLGSPARQADLSGCRIKVLIFMDFKSQQFECSFRMKLRMKQQSLAVEGSIPTPASKPNQLEL
jgi:hypothetical protein